jgi:hypothetical protein
MVPERLPLASLLSQALIAFTIELDNEFERRFAEAGGGARVTSLTMWSNLLRFVRDGITVGAFVEAVGLPKAQALSRLGGVERWRYVTVGPGSGKKRTGYGSARGTKDDWIVRFTAAGERAASIWPGLPKVVEERWRRRFGLASVEDLVVALREAEDGLDVALPAYLPVISSTHGMALELPSSDARGAGQPALVSQLAHALMAYTLEFEANSPVSLPLSANMLRVLRPESTPVRELPAHTGISKEAVEVSLTALRRTDYVLVEGAPASKRTIRLTPLGEDLRAEQRRLHARLERRRDGRIRGSLERILAHPELAAGLTPHPEGWRASKPYAARTAAVLHRGGWPDGS